MHTSIHKNTFTHTHTHTHAHRNEVVILSFSIERHQLAEFGRHRASEKTEHVFTLIVIVIQNGNRSPFIQQTTENAVRVYTFLVICCRRVEPYVIGQTILYFLSLNIVTRLALSTQKELFLLILGKLIRLACMTVDQSSSPQFCILNVKPRHCMVCSRPCTVNEQVSDVRQPRFVFHYTDGDKSRKNALFIFQIISNRKLLDKTDSHHLIWIMLFHFSTKNELPVKI